MGYRSQLAGAAASEDGELEHAASPTTGSCGIRIVDVVGDLAKDRYPGLRHRGEKCSYLFAKFGCFGDVGLIAETVPHASTHAGV